MLTDRETNFVYMSELLPGRHPALANTLERIFEEHQVRYTYLQGTRDIWCRDYMPIQIDVGSFLKYRYFPDYLRGEYEHQITDVDVVAGISFKPNQVTKTDFILDGGNVVHYRRHACMTDKIYRENKEVDQEALRSSLETSLGVTLIVVPKEPYDAIGHTDGMLRFVDETTVIVNDYRGIAASYHQRLIRMLTEHGFQSILLPYEPPSNGTDWKSAWGNYVNYLQVGQLILIPQYQMAADKEAEEVLQKSFPDRTLIGVDCRDLSKEGGVLNCITWSIRQ
jgi:agmatine deiminase